MLLKERITQLEVSLTDARQAIKSKDLEITNLETKETDLQLQVERWVKTMEVIKGRLPFRPFWGCMKPLRTKNLEI